MGTPDFAVNSLKVLCEKHDVIGAFTKVDKPNLRGGKIKFVPVKEYALEKGIPIYQPNSVKTEETLNIVRELNPDLIVVVAYGKILPKELIDIPKYGVINVHSSLLPKYRGAAPIHAAMINGEKETGVTIMYIAEELDAGDMILQSKTEINEEDNLGTLHDRLANIGAETLMEAVELIFQGKANRIEQNHSEATFVKPIRKNETKIDWFKGSREIFNFVRGMNPFPTAYTTCDEKIFKLYAVEICEKVYNGEVGEIVGFIKGKGPLVKTGDGTVTLISVKPEGKKTLSGSDIINGNYFKIGNLLK
jgi:methionyl-tRNA formyltransferase